MNPLFVGARVLQIWVIGGAFCGCAVKALSHE